LPLRRPGLRANLLSVDREVGSRREALLVEPESSVVLGARRCDCSGDVDVHVERAELWQSAKWKNVRCTDLDGLGVGDDDFLRSPCRDWKHARRELVPCPLLHERRILTAMEEVLVGLTRRLLLDDLAFLPHVPNLHREAAQRRSLRQGDPECPFEDAIFWVLERQMELCQRQRILYYGRLGTKRCEPKPGPVRCGQAHRNFRR